MFNIEDSNIIGFRSLYSAVRIPKSQFFPPPHPFTPLPSHFRVHRCPVCTFFGRVSHFTSNKLWDMLAQNFWSHASRGPPVHIFPTPLIVFVWSSFFRAVSRFRVATQNMSEILLNICFCLDKMREERQFCKWKSMEGFWTLRYSDNTPNHLIRHFSQVSSWISLTALSRRRQ